MIDPPFSLPADCTPPTLEQRLDRIYTLGVCRRIRVACR